MPTSTSSRSPRTLSAGASTDGAVVETQFLERLATQINTFMAEMSAAAFARRYTATQIVRAVAFLLAIALRGRRKG